MVRHSCLLKGSTNGRAHFFDFTIGIVKILFVEPYLKPVLGHRFITEDSLCLFVVNLSVDFEFRRIELLANLLYEIFVLPETSVTLTIANLDDIEITGNIFILPGKLILKGLDLEFQTDVGYVFRGMVELYFAERSLLRWVRNSLFPLS